MTWESERKRMTESIGVHGWTTRISWLLGVLFAIIGVIAEIVDTTFIIESMSWYLLSIATFAGGIINAVAFLIGVYLHDKK